LPNDEEVSVLNVVGAFGIFGVMRFGLGAGYFVDVAELLPLVKRTGGLTVEYVAGSMVEAYKVFELLALASSGYGCDSGSNITTCVWAGFCGERNFKRRRQLTPYTFFYHVEAMLAWAVVVDNVRADYCGRFLHVLLISTQNK
jgi:hypothetical protein